MTWYSGWAGKRVRSPAMGLPTASIHETQSPLTMLLEVPPDLA